MTTKELPNHSAHPCSALRRCVGATFLALLAGTTAHGCSMTGYMTAAGGFTASASSLPGRDGPQAAIQIGVGEDGLGAGAAIRMQLTPNVREVGLAGELFAMYLPLALSPMARVGIELLQFGNIDDTFSFGMFSPYLEAGFAWLTPRGSSAAGPFMVAVVGVMKGSVRFTGQPSEFGGGFLISVGYGGGGWK